MLRRFATGCCVVNVFIACGGQTGDDGSIENQNTGGSASGGETPGYVGGASSAGGSTGVDPKTYCNGLLATSPSPCDVEQFVNVTSCDIPLQQAPSDPTRVGVAIDCVQIFSVAPDAGAADGYYIDYSQFPQTHLVMTGTACTNLLANRLQRLVVAEGCPYIR